MEHEQKYTTVDPSSLVPHPANPRRGDVDAIAESIEANGFYGALVVQSSTRRVIAGNHRLEAALRLGLDEVPIIELDVDDDTALRVLLADNRTNDIAAYDNASLAELLEEIGNTSSLLGTGYSEQDVEDLLRLVESTTATPVDPYQEWTGMPEFTQEDKNSTYRSTIHFRSEEDADAFFLMIGQPRKPYFWWPEDDDHVGSDVNEAYITQDD